MVSFGNFTIYGLLIDTLFGRFARQWSIANRRISLCEAKPLRRKRGLATRGYQDLPAPTRTYRTPSESCLSRYIVTSLHRCKVTPWNAQRTTDREAFDPVRAPIRGGLGKSIWILGFGILAQSLSRPGSVGFGFRPSAFGFGWILVLCAFHGVTLQRCNEV